jgi:archaellin
MNFLASLLAPVWRYVAAAAAAVLALGGIYLKGRSDQKAKAKLEDVSNANQIRKAGADARASAAAGGVHDNDGWRRD